VLTRRCPVETIRIPNVFFPLLIAYALFAYAAFLAWKPSSSSFGLLTMFSFMVLAFIEGAPILLFFFTDNLESNLSMLFELRRWLNSLLLIAGPISIIVALRLRSVLNT
ncbi:hypothetical protein NAV39_14105, partial [Pseudomonas zhaodongensis]|uniref:hypothetical protein n=1 Tax=Stutzerimonas zhaodongensis TaxID=1176257 RepID=UPI00210BBF16